MAAGQCPGTALDHQPADVAPSFVMGAPSVSGPDFTKGQQALPVAKIELCIRCGLVFWTAL